jgi:hypothetical protein
MKQLYKIGMELAREVQAFTMPFSLTPFFSSM